MIDDFSRIQNIVSQQLGIDPQKIKSDADFGKELGADSLDVVELVMTIEDEFDMEIEDKAASQMRTIQDVLDYINNQVNNRHWLLLIIASTSGKFG